MLAIAVADDDERSARRHRPTVSASAPPGRSTRRKGRPTKGVRTIKASDRKGRLIAARTAVPGDELLVISQQGQVIRMTVDSVKQMGRSTEGVRLMNVKDGDEVAAVAPVVEGAGTNGGDDEPEPDGTSED